MSRRITLSVILAILVIASFVLSTCGSPTPAPVPTTVPSTPTPTPTPDPMVTLRECGIDHVMLRYEPEVASGWQDETLVAHDTWVFVGKTQPTFDKANFEFVWHSGQTTKELAEYNGAPVFAQVWGDQIDLSATTGAIEARYFSKKGLIGSMTNGVLDFQVSANCTPGETTPPQAEELAGYKYAGKLSQIAPWDGTTQSSTFLVGDPMTASVAEKLGGKLDPSIGMSSGTHGGFNVTQEADGVYLTWWTPGTAFMPAESHIATGIHLPYGKVVLVKTTFCNSDAGCWPPTEEKIVFFPNNGGLQFVLQ